MHANPHLLALAFASTVLPVLAQEGTARKTDWKWLAPRRIEFRSKETAEVLKDGSVQFSAPGPGWSEPSLHFKFRENRAIRHIRLEVLPDSRSTDRRLGRERKKLMLFQFQAYLKREDTKARYLEFRSCRYLQGRDDRNILDTIDYQSDTGWRIPPLGKNQSSAELVFELDETLHVTPADELVIAVDTGGAPEFDTLARIRIWFERQRPLRSTLKR